VSEPDEQEQLRERAALASQLGVEPLLNGDEPEPDWDALAEEAAEMDRYCLGCYAW
jgi:hypothetical protein